MWIELAILLAAAAAWLGVPFAIGLVNGPPAPGSVTGASPVMRPLSRIAGLYGRFMIVYLLFAAQSIRDGYFGGSFHGGVCVDTGYPVSGVKSLGVAAKTGASVSATGNVQACALHPSAGQWVLFLLTKLAGPALLACVLLLTWQLIREASAHGPFTWQAASIMWRLGWVVIAGSMIAAAISALGSDVLTTMLMTPATYDTQGIIGHILLFAPIRALFPVPALAGAALLSFARITRAGAVMDKELKATV